MFTALLLAAATIMPATGEELKVYGAESSRIDVAYEELRTGDNAAAVARIRASGLLADGDPAALINLGAAYSRLGDKGAARDCYRSAIISKTRYDLELADGAWMDSRAAARLAIVRLDQGRTLALR